MQYIKKVLISVTMLVLFVGCGDTDKALDDALNKMRIWQANSEQIEITRHNGISSDLTTAKYTYTRDMLSKYALNRLHNTYAARRIEGGYCSNDGVTYTIKVIDKDDKSTLFYSHNAFCDNGSKKQYISVVSIEKLMEILND